MITFVICDDNKHVREIIQTIIAKATMSYDFNYKVKLFEKYDNNLQEMINDTSNIKIYLLDIEMPGKNGIEIAKRIRKVDWDSIIIFLTTHEELELNVLKQRLLVLDFVSKFENYEAKIIEAINLVLNNINKNKILTIKTFNEIYHIKIDSILYICKDSYKQTSIIVTEKEKYEIYEPLYKIAEKLDSNFIRTHRACYVNTKKIKHIDFTKKEIIFNNGKRIYYLSRNYKKEVEKII